MDNPKNSLLLLDNDSMCAVGNGTYKIDSISLDEAKSIIEVFGDVGVCCCYSDRTIDRVLTEYLNIEIDKFHYGEIFHMEPGQSAIVFKRYITPSETQPVITTEDGIEAKKIQNIYVYCEYINKLT
ncbi:MAG: hypothetical protein LUG85_05970 [Clostridiales bacterium]|nr:hypothetical protein [Clostridiales bacterium]MCD7828065.1 hypothetical protein [Clostridiales bacterium]